MLKGPLSGVRVIDLSRAFGGSYGSMHLGNLGADVIKIEQPGGDIVRSTAGPKLWDENFYYLALNSNKRNLKLNVTTEIGKEVFYELVKVSDVVWDNFRPGVMKRLGIDYETLIKLNPRIISSSQTGYGSTGPYSNRPAYDLMALGFSGLLSITGEPGRTPVRPGIALADLVGGTFLTTATIAALFEREKTGKGRKVEVNLLDCMLSMLTNFFSYYFMTDEVPPPQGPKHITFVPFGIYPTKQGYICIGISWPRICRVLDIEWMATDPRFSTGEARLKNREEFERLFEEALAKAPAEDWLDLMNVEDIPAAPVNTISQAAIDPQVRHNKMILNMEHPLGGKYRIIGNPMRVGVVGDPSPAAPMGFDTKEVLTDVLKYPDSKVEAFEKIQSEQESQKDKKG